MPGYVAAPPVNTVTGDPWTAPKLLANSPYVTGIVCTQVATLPPWRGVGYIAGEAPDGLVTFNGAGAVRTLDLFDRATNTYITSTVSASDGTYKFSGLNMARTFDVRARGSSTTENDVIASQVTPTAQGLHAYWRLLTQANNGANFNVGLRRIQFRGYTGGPDQSAGGTPLSSSNYSASYTVAFAYGPDNAALADANNSWATANNDKVGSWIGYHFPTPVPVGEVALLALKTDPNTQMPRDFDIQYSDNGTTWVTAKSITGASAWGAGELRTFAV